MRSVVLPSDRFLVVLVSLSDEPEDMLPVIVLPDVLPITPFSYLELCCVWVPLEREDVLSPFDTLLCCLLAEAPLLSLEILKSPLMDELSETSAKSSVDFTFGIMKKRLKITSANANMAAMI